MNVKKIVLSLSATGLLSVPFLSAIGQSSVNSSQAYLPPVIDFILNTDSDNSSGEVEPDFGLDPALQPWENFDLSVWGLDSPAIENTNLTVDPGDAPEGVRIDDFEFIALEQGSSNNSFNSARELFFGERSNVESTAPYFLWRHGIQITC